jgi:sodium transport system permease protein
MNWRHVQLIFHREMRDQLRDRRTLFTITVLPILLYPLIGMLMMQVAQFNREYSVRIRVVGQENWPQDLPLLDQDKRIIARQGAERLSDLIELDLQPWPTDDAQLIRLQDEARADVKANVVDAVLFIQPAFEQRLQRRSPEVALQAHPGAPSNTEEGANSELAANLDEESVDGLHLLVNLARDHSQLAKSRIQLVLNAWQRAWVSEQLLDAGMNPLLVEPLALAEEDTSALSVRRAMLWSKVLPFVMLVWALTGAFYPAIDLCAGEKERGTLETLLSSPARRNEIVWGKLLTVSVFSISSALLNLMSMHLTAGMIVKQLAATGSSRVAETLGPLPIHAFGWLVLLLIPMAAFFSALALAVAALARSTKEGQYYLMPLLLVTLPLVSLPMIPSLELNLGTSLVPVSGAVFLVKSLIEGRYAEALMHLPVVIMVTAACCLLSIRWAIRQFESESVMFSESDRWNLQIWIRQVWRDRGMTASPTEAVLCGLIILVSMFFAQFVAGSTVSDWRSIVSMTVAVQVGLILTPSLMMAIFLTRSIRSALRIHRTQPSHLVAALLLGFTLHPTYTALGNAIQHVYGFGPEIEAVLAHFSALVSAQPLWAVLLLLAILPAVCEELAFRGFIFGGLLRQGGVLRAILVSAVFFGFTHTVLQQSIAASIMGLMLGLIAWRTGGVICTMFVHAINNILSISLGWFAANGYELPNQLEWCLRSEGGGWVYQPAWQTISVGATLILIAVLFQRSRDTQRVVQEEMGD